MKRKYILTGLFITLVLPSIPGFADNDLVKHEYMPGQEKVIPHVSGDEMFSDSYKYWKDAESVRKASKDGLMSHEMNFKDFRWLDKSLEGELVVEEGLAYFNKKNDSGKSCASCHGTNGEKLKNTYAEMPKYNKRLDRVVVAPTQIEICAKERLGLNDWGVETRPNTLIAFYLASLADGVRINVDTSSSPMKASYDRGRKLYFKRVGQFHYACSSCHTPPTVGKYLRGQRPTTFFGDATQYPIYHFPYQLPGDTSYVFTLQHQIRSCQKLSRMYQGKEGSASMTDIEVFLRASSNGHPISVPVAEYNMNTDYLERGQQLFKDN